MVHTKKSVLRKWSHKTQAILLNPCHHKKNTSIYKKSSTEATSLSSYLFGLITSMGSHIIPQINGVQWIVRVELSNIII